MKDPEKRIWTLDDYIAYDSNHVWCNEYEEDVFSLFKWFYGDCMDCTVDLVKMTATIVLEKGTKLSNLRIENFTNYRLTYDHPLKGRKIQYKFEYAKPRRRR